MENSIQTETSMTPMLRQYFSLKQEAGDAVLFFRMGDFYEVFGDDALNVAPRLGLAMASRERGDQNKIPFCGVPHHSVKHHWTKLLKAGFKVAVADQTEDPKFAKGLVRREITKILTPSCSADAENLSDDKPQYLFSVLEDPHSKKWAICLTDTSTGEIRLGEVSTEEEVFEWIERIDPLEILARKFQWESWKGREKLRGISSSDLNEQTLRDPDNQSEILKKVFGSLDLSGFVAGQFNAGKPLLAGVLDHIIRLKQSTDQFSTILRLIEPSTMQLDAIACRDLEIFETVRRRQSEGSLFREINLCKTPMGSRLLRDDLLQPLLKQAEISERLDGVEYFVKNNQLCESLRQLLENVGDLTRLQAKISTKSITTLDLDRIRTSLRLSLTIAEHLNRQSTSSPPCGIILEITESLSAPSTALEEINHALVDSPSTLGSGEAIFKDEFDKELSDLRHLMSNGQNLVDAYESKLRQDTGIPSLKIKEHKSFGLLIEVTKTHLAKIPSYFVRRQTMVNNERFVTEELAALDAKLRSAKDQYYQREFFLFEQLLLRLIPCCKEILKKTQAIARLDVLLCHAQKARVSNYTRPMISKEQKLSLIRSRHPVVEKFVGMCEFVPNDLILDRQNSVVMLTGPNMGGKSTFMRQLCIIALLHQIGSFVPAESASLPVFDGIFTRIGASDDLSKGQSTFLVEMAETAHILRRATDRSLVILDEIGRGTSTKDGSAIANAVLKEFAETKKCYLIFATHYHELTRQTKDFRGLRYLQAEVLVQNDAIKLTHRITEGFALNSHGIEIARRAGISPRVIKTAQEHLSSMGADPITALNEILPSMMESKIDPTFDIIRSKLMAVSINKITPLKALNILDELRTLAEYGDTASQDVFANLNPHQKMRSLFD